MNDIQTKIEELSIDLKEKHKEDIERYNNTLEIAYQYRAEGYKYVASQIELILGIVKPGLQTMNEK